MSRNIVRFDLFGYIDPDVSAAFIRSLWEEDCSDPDAVWEVILNTDGGDMVAGTAIYSELASYSERAGGSHYVAVRVRGQAASCGSLILQAGDLRAAGYMDYIMLHEPLLSFEDATLQRVRDEIRQAESWTTNFLTVITQRGNKDRFWYADKLAFGRDWWVSAREALECGLIDEIA
jgi:ATP-dependent protease ClpP protease subunit